MNRRTFLTTTAGFGVPFLSGRSPRAQNLQESMIASLEKLIPELMRDANVPGLSICLVNNGGVWWRSGFGVKDSATREPVSNETLFEAASISKTVFAYTVLTLCDNGILKLDRPLVEYDVPPLVTDDPRINQITARHVLSHTSGFQDFRSRKEPLKIHFTPGEKFLYSGEGYYYLQTVVTHLTGHVDRSVCATYEAGLEVCGTDFDDYMKRTLLRPLGMKTSGYQWDDVLAKHSATPHDTSGKPFEKKKPKTPDVARYGSCGGLHTTASEYARFLLAVVNPAPADALRLREQTRQEMLRPEVRLPPDQKIDGADAWALGWAIQERKTGNVIVHSGAQAGFQCLTMASVDRKSGFVVLGNSDNGWKIFHDVRFRREMDQLLAPPA